MTTKKTRIRRAEKLRRSLALTEFMNMDHYGKDLPIPTSGKDNIYRCHKNQEGWVVKLTLLSESETTEYRKEHKGERE